MYNINRYVYPVVDQSVKLFNELVICKHANTLPYTWSEKERKTTSSKKELLTEIIGEEKNKVYLVRQVFCGDPTCFSFLQRSTQTETVSNIGSIVWLIS
jgi:hypothetical protein